MPTEDTSTVECAICGRRQRLDGTICADCERADPYRVRHARRELPSDTPGVGSNPGVAPGNERRVDGTESD